MLTLKTIDHINIVVHDMDAMIAFYCDVLGFQKTKDVIIQGNWIQQVVSLPDVKAHVVYLQLPAGPRLELIDYHNPVSPTLPAGSPHHPGLRHMAFEVDDLDLMVAQLKKAGVRLVGQPMTVPDAQVTYDGGIQKRLVYFTDPQGNLLELCSYTSSV